MTELSGLQIFKYLPAAKKAEHTNCKMCGCPTCMAFALKLAKHNIDIEKCPYVPDELKKICEQNAKEPQKTVDINGLKIGGENVLYRHEKTFINKTAIAVVIDLSKPHWKEKYEQVKNFEITRVNEHLKIDLIITKNGSLPDCITYEDLKKLPLKEIVDEEFSKTADEKLYLKKTKNFQILCTFISNILMILTFFVQKHRFIFVNMLICLFLRILIRI